MLRFRDIGKLKKGDYSVAAVTLRAEEFGSPTPIPTADPAVAAPLRLLGPDGRNTRR